MAKEQTVTEGHTAADRMADNPDVLELLLTQHAQIEELFNQVLAAEGDHRQERFDELVRLLAVHETAEEEVLHPVARRTIEAGEEVVSARLEEEREAKQLLADLQELGTEAPDFTGKLLALRAEVLEHATREERYEFPYLRRRLEPAAAQRLANALRAAEAIAPTRPHPGLESGAANAAAGPVLAVIDRLRDAMRSSLREDEQ